MFYLIACIAAIALIICFLVSSPGTKNKSVAGDSATGKPVSEEYFISTESQSNDRVKKLQLDVRSEDASYILDKGKLSFSHTIPATEDRDYKADLHRDWVIELTQVNSENFKKSDLEKLFDLDWRKNYPSTIYGFSPADNHWTYVFAGDAPEAYSKIEVAIDLQEIFGSDEIPYDPKKLKNYPTELEAKIRSYPSPLKVVAREAIPHAINKAKSLVALNQEFDIEAIILLKSDNQFNGRLAWDALQSVGLKWGDGDLFHWDNEEDFGHDQHFSVWTTTDPGYFLPERIKDGSMNPGDLGFSFSVPRSADPKNVFAVMIDVAKYCQKRLGGTILNQNEAPFNDAEEKRQLDHLIEKMKVKGLTPGSDKALGMF